MLSKLLNTKKARLSVFLTRDIAFCYLYQANDPSKKLAEFSLAVERFANPDPLKEWLPNGYNLREVKVTLGASLYSPNILDVPAAVQEDKIIKQAIFWKIKDKMQLPPKELIIDYIDLPDKTSKSEGKKNIMAFIVKKSIFAPLLQFVESEDVLLKTVNAVSFVYPSLLDLKESETVYVIDCQDEQSQLCVFNGKKLLFIRSLGFDESVLLSDDPQDIYTVNMEIMRSRDFLSRHFTKSEPAKKVFILTKREDSTQQLENLSNELELPCFNLNPDNDLYLFAKTAVNMHE